MKSKPDLTGGSGYATSPFFLYYDLEARQEDYADIQSVTMMAKNEIVFENDSGSKGEIVDSIWDFVVKYVKGNQCYIGKDNTHYVKLVAHNGGGYDHLFLLGRIFSMPFWSIGWRIDFNVVQGGHVKHMRIINESEPTKLVIDLFDTYSVFPSSLAEYGRVIGMPKLECEDWSDSEKIKEYRRRDVEILVRYCTFVEKAMWQFFDNTSVFGTFDKPLYTQSMLAKKVMKQIHKNMGDPFGYNKRTYAMGGNDKLWEGITFKQPGKVLAQKGIEADELASPIRLDKSVELEDFAKHFPGIKVRYDNTSDIVINSGLGESRIGGLVSVTKSGYFPSIVQLDVNSMYVDIMRKPLAYNFESLLTLPTIDTCKDYYLSGKAVFILGQVIIPPTMPIGLIPVKKGVTIRPNGQVFSGTFIAFELLEYVLAYGGKVIPLQALIFSREPFAKPFAEFVWSKRLEAKKSKNLGEDYIWKIIGNAQTGCWGQRPDYAAISLDSATIGNRFDTRDENIRPYVQPQTYTHITSIGQAMMLGVMIANVDKIIYCDTDGVKFAAKSLSEIDTCGIGIGNDLGQFKPEYIGNRAIIADSKSYAIDTGESITVVEEGRERRLHSWTIKMKGIPDSVLLLRKERKEDGTYKKLFDIRAYFALLCDMKAVGLRAIESFQTMTGLMNEARLAVPADTWQKASVETRERLTLTYAEIVCKKKPFHYGNESTYNRRNIRIDGFMPLQTNTSKQLQHFRSRAVLHEKRLDYRDVYVHIMENPDTPMTSECYPHLASTKMYKNYTVQCRNCGNSLNMQLNLIHGVRCVQCGLSVATILLHKTLTTHIDTMTPEFLLSCGFDRIKVSKRIVETIGGFIYEPDTDHPIEDTDE